MLFKEIKIKDTIRIKDARSYDPVNSCHYPMELLSGHPFLVRRALYLVASGRLSNQLLFSETTGDRGPFGDHLRNQLFQLHERPELVEGLRQVVQKKSYQDERVYDKWLAEQALV